MMGWTTRFHVEVRGGVAAKFPDGRQGLQLSMGGALSIEVGLVGHGASKSGNDAAKVTEGVG